MEEIRLFQGQFVLKLNQLFWNIFQKKKMQHTQLFYNTVIFLPCTDEKIGTCS